jgi:type I restriction enzyme R subunit
MVFGDEIHRYSIADGIRDKNVLGFDLDKMPTFLDPDVRRAVALEKAKAKNVAEAVADEKKSKTYYRYMKKIAMAGHYGKDGKYVKGIEDYLPASQYDGNEEHRGEVVKDVFTNWLTLSRGGKFHAIFATSSIAEAIGYYKLIKARNPDLKTTALFDPAIDNVGDGGFKEDGLVEIIEDYNERYGQSFTIASHARFKKDIASRLAHKGPYTRIELDPDKRIDLLIVVDQMLTGFDSKWVNTLYLDKVLEYSNIIQAFSRTNRLFGPDKPFGTIRYYRKPHTMERYIAAAVKLYSGEKTLGLFVDKIGENIAKMNAAYDEIGRLFAAAGIPDFHRLPDDNAVRGKFALLFKVLSDHLEAARIQGFKWGRPEHGTHLDEQTYLVLALRYKELAGGGGGGTGEGDVPYDIAGHLTEIDTGLIDDEYMNSRFDKYLKELRTGGGQALAVGEALNDLHKSFATLTREEQKYADLFRRDVERGDVDVEDGKTLRDYITEYRLAAKDSQIEAVCDALGVDGGMLRDLMKLRVTKANINEYGRFDKLAETVDISKAKAYFETRDCKAVSTFATHSKVNGLLQKFVLSGGFEIW